MISVTDKDYTVTKIVFRGPVYQAILIRFQLYIMNIRGNITQFDYLLGF